MDVSYEKLEVHIKEKIMSNGEQFESLAREYVYYLRANGLTEKEIVETLEGIVNDTMRSLDETKEKYPKAYYDIMKFYSYTRFNRTYETFMFSEDFILNINKKPKSKYTILFRNDKLKTEDTNIFLSGKIYSDINELKSNLLNNNFLRVSDSGNGIYFNKQNGYIAEIKRFEDYS